MKRIAVTGLGDRNNLLVAKALSIMCGYELSISPSFSQVAIKYGLDLNIEQCQWPDSYVYCLDAFTERIIEEQRYSEKIVSDGSVLKELVWIKCRYPHVELVYEQAMIRSLERVLVEYALKNYDVIFHLFDLTQTDTSGACMYRLSEVYRLPCQRIDSTDKEHILQTMSAYMKIKPVMAATYSLSKAMREL